MNEYFVALREEVKNRARVYYNIYRELSREIGEERAIGILKRAIYERGKEKGVQLAKKIGEPDLHKLAHDFVAVKKEVDVFGHELVRVDDNHALLRLNHCPMLEAWGELGLSPEEQKTLCDCAYQVDFGKFEAAGYELKFDCRISEGDSTCDLHLTKPENPSRR